MKLMTSRKRARGVTLIELLTVVIIIGILASIAVPSYRSYLLRSHRTTATTALLRIQAAQEKFFLANNKYSNNLTAAVSAGGLGIPNTTENGAFYDLAFDGTKTSDTSFTVLATPRAAGGQTSDTKCVEFSIDQNGTRKALKAGRTDNTAECWR